MNKLLNETFKLVKTEQALTIKVIEKLQEVENQKAYLCLGYNSLFQYCVRELNYSPAQATVRVNCVRLVKENPQVKEKIKQGSLSPSSASRIQSFIHYHELKST